MSTTQEFRPRKKWCLRDELRKRFKSPEALLRQLGMDSALLEGKGSRSVTDNKAWQKFPTERSRSMTPDMMEEPDMQFDMAPIKEYLAARGISSDEDWNEFMSLLPEHMQGDMSDEEAERAFAEHGHSEAHGQQEPRQRNLEGAERRVAPEHTAQNREADRREAKNSVQREGRDEMPSRANGNLPRNRFQAHDGDLDFLDEAFTRLAPTGGRCLTRAEQAAEAEAWRHRNPRRALALDAAKREREDKAFYEKFPGLRNRKPAMATDSGGGDVLAEMLFGAMRVNVQS